MANSQKAPVERYVARYLATADVPQAAKPRKRRPALVFRPVRMLRREIARHRRDMEAQYGVPVSMATAIEDLIYRGL